MSFEWPSKSHDYEWFMYTIKVNDDLTVTKTPRTLAHTNWYNEDVSLKIHKDYLWKDIVAETDIHTAPLLTSFETHQEFILWTPINLETTTNQAVFDLLEAGASMQEKEKILFDVFGLEWMIRLFNHYFGDRLLWNMNDMFLPLNAQYLNLVHNFPPELLKKLKEKEGDPFIAHNILEGKDGSIHCVDTDYRPLDIWSGLNPLNHIGAWITKKALDDLKNR